jgi:hypothetical protein
VRSYFRLNAAEQAQERRLLQSSVNGEVQAMLLTEFGKLEEEAWQRGRQEGLHVVQNALIGILRHHFDDLPAQMEAQIRREEDLDVLNDAIQRALTAASLEEIWPPRGLAL